MTTETITWHAVESLMPDAEKAVLIYCPIWGNDHPIGVGWWGGTEWRDAEGWPLDDGEVTHWSAIPRGPR